jgi:hypothetical protein
MDLLATGLHLQQLPVGPDWVLRSCCCDACVPLPVRMSVCGLS